MKPWLKRCLGPLVLAVALAVVAHVATVYAIPRVLMHDAIQRIGRDGVNTWLGARRITPKFRKIVRPSPELAYSACVYDLRHGPVHIWVQPMADYWSLSLFDAATDNYRVWDDRTTPKGVDIWLVHGAVDNKQPPAGVTVVTSPSARGIALIRRHVRNAAQWPQILAARSKDQCNVVH